MRMTRTSAITSVLNVSFRNTFVNAVVSSESATVTPSGMSPAQRSTSFFTRAAVSTEFASGVLKTDSHTPSWSLKRERIL